MPADRNILLTPGPTAVPPAVLQEMALPIIHHRTKAFQAIFADLTRGLQTIFQTAGPVLSIAGSGTTSFEAAQLSLAKPGSTVISVAGGKFGERWQDVFDTYAPYMQLKNVKISHAWGAPAPLDEIEQALKDHPDASVIAVVHSETSTATASDVQAVAKLAQQHDCLLIVDGITSVGAFACPMDEWGIDCLVTGSQKALMLPPGLGYVGLGERAIARLKSVDKLPAYNLDLRKWLKSAEKNDVPFTPPVALIRAQKVACDMINALGLAATQARTHKLADASRKAFAAVGLKLISSSPSDSVTGVFYPDGVDDSKFRAAVRDNHGVHIAGGQDGRGAKWKASIFRISHMGYVSADDTRAGLDAIETELKAAGALADVAAGSLVKAFNEVHG